jgi:hypothetical protein
LEIGICYEALPPGQTVCFGSRFGQGKFPGGKKWKESLYQPAEESGLVWQNNEPKAGRGDRASG